MNFLGFLADCIDNQVVEATASSFAEEAHIQVDLEVGDDSDRDVLGQQVHT